MKLFQLLEDNGGQLHLLAYGDGFEYELAPGLDWGLIARHPSGLIGMCRSWHDWADDYCKEELGMTAAEAYAAHAELLNHPETAVVSEVNLATGAVEFPVRAMEDRAAFEWLALIGKE